MILVLPLSCRVFILDILLLVRHPLKYCFVSEFFFDEEVYIHCINVLLALDIRIILEHLESGLVSRQLKKFRLNLSPLI